MKRDMDLVRRILLELEENAKEEGGPIQVKIDDVEPVVVSYHVRLMFQAGLIEAVNCSTIDVSIDWRALCLTWDGHEFLDAARSETVWEAAKTKTMKLGGGVAFGVLKTILIDTAKEMLGTK